MACDHYEVELVGAAFSKVTSPTPDAQDFLKYVSFADLLVSFLD